MTRNLKICLLLSVYIIFFPGFTYSDENKVASQDESSDKSQIEKMMRHHSGVVSPKAKKKFSMNIIRPNPNIDPEIVRNTFDPNIDYKLIIIGPYSRKEITGFKGQCFGSLRHKFLPKGKRYETPIISPSE